MKTTDLHVKIQKCIMSLQHINSEKEKKEREMYSKTRFINGKFV